LPKKVDISTDFPDDKTIIYSSDTYKGKHEIKSKIFATIFSHLNNKDFLNLRKVNKKFYNASKDPEVLKNIGGLPGLVLAAMNNQQKTVKYLCEQPETNIDVKNKNEITPLMIAAKEGNLDALKCLIKNGANHREKDISGRIALIYAIIQTHYTAERLKINDANILTNYGIRSIKFDTLTAKSYNLGVIKELINVDKATINELDAFKNTPLMYAAICGDKHMVQFLLDNGAEVDSKNSYNMTPLMFASICGNIEVVELLLTKGSDINAKNTKEMTPLMFASINGNIEVVKFLLTNGADINAKDNDGKTPLMFAAEHGNIEVVKFLLANGADIFAKTNRSKKNFFDFVSMDDKDMQNVLIDYDKNNGNKILLYAKENNRKLYRILFENSPLYTHEKLITEFISALKADDTKKLNNILKYVNETNINNKNDEGDTLLLIATQHGNEKIVSILLKMGANVNCKNNKKDTPLLIATERDNKQIVSILLEKKANVNCKNNQGNTPLLFAIENDNIEILENLINYGADVNLQDWNYETPLMLAAALGHIKAAKVLIENGANILLKNASGFTAIEIAKQRKHTEIVELLSERLSKINLT